MPMTEATGTNITPRIDVALSTADFLAPDPDSVKDAANDDNTIFDWGGVKIVKLSPGMVVKFGPHVTVTEAKSMVFVSEKTKVPVPKVFACYSYGPIQRDVEDYGSLFDTYIFMSYVDGQTLDNVWESYDETTKHCIADQLKQYFHDLRGISGGIYLGSIDRGPITDPILSNLPDKGPFDSEQAFNDAMVNSYLTSAPKRHIRNFLTAMLSQNTHRIVFTHGDLRLQNIVVKDGRVCGILDWEYSGWYPEYWEFSKALYVWKWQNDWTDYLVEILHPYYSEYTLHSFLTEVAW